MHADMSLGLRVRVSEILGRQKIRKGLRPESSGFWFNQNLQKSCHWSPNSSHGQRGECMTESSMTDETLCRIFLVLLEH